MALKTSFQSQRLHFQPVQWEDLEVIHQLHSHAETNRFNTLGIPSNLEETKFVLQEFIKAYHKFPLNDHTFSIRPINSQEFIGLVALRRDNPKYRGADIWYKITPEQWGKGYATEAVKSIIHFGFETLRLHRIQASCAIANKASIRVMEKSGMRLEGHKRAVMPLKDGWSDCAMYAIVETDHITGQ